MLGEFFHWWAERLGEMLPWGGRLRPEAQGRALLAMPAAPGSAVLDLILRQRGGERPLGRFASDEAGSRALRAASRAGRAPVVLRLPDGMLLEREVVLPLAAEREAGRALRYEMDRLTPFRPDEVFWSWEVLRRERARGRLHLRLSLVPRAALEPALAALAAAGMPAARLEGRNAAGAWRAIGMQGAEPARWQRLAPRAAALACAALAVAVLVTPFVRQSLARGAVERRIAALQPRVHAAEALRRRIAQAAAGGDAIAAARSASGDALAILAAVTEILPDDTYLTEFSLKQRDMTLRGESANAARLIALLAADPEIRNPAFAAPVTRALDGSADLFTIHAGVAP